jgi:hypothetical protein
MFSKNTCTSKYWKDTDKEFEDLRKIVLDDPTNVNKGDFTKDKLILSNHENYCVIFNNNGDPICMGGLYEISSGVGRLQNRYYVFPNYRAKTWKELVHLCEITVEYIYEPMLKESPFHTHIITMTNRGERNSHFNSFTKVVQTVCPNKWHRINGYVQTSKSMVRRSWQNALTDNPQHNLRTLNHDQWLLLP